MFSYLVRTTATRRCRPSFCNRAQRIDGSLLVRQYANKKDEKRKKDGKCKKEKKPKKDCKPVEEKKPSEAEDKCQDDKKKKARVAILGAAGRVGSMLALMLKQSPWIETLVMHDLKKSTCGIAMDISHIDTSCRVQAYTGEDQLGPALAKANIVLICAGKSRQPGKPVEKLFKENAEIVRNIAECCSCCCPKAFIGILTQPINSLMPMVCEALKKKCKLDPKRVFGISSVNVVRATTFTAEALDLDPTGVIVPVVGGHSENTLVPILSQTKPCSKLPGRDTCEIIRLVKKSSCWVFEMKDRKAPAVICPAYAAARFTNNLLRALDGQPGVYECVYVQTNASPGVSYCTIPVELSPEGIKEARMPKMCDYELRLFQDAICELAPEIKKGEDFVLKDKKC